MSDPSESFIAKSTVKAAEPAKITSNIPSEDITQLFRRGFIT